MNCTFLSKILRVSAAALLSVAAGNAATQSTFPDRPIILIVSAAPGGNNGHCRSFNCPGLARAKPDGYTLLLQYSGFQVITPHITPNAGWDPIKDFSPVANLTSWGKVVKAANIQAD